jgi:quercetin dioxygenase-like cupin family protein
VNKLLHYGQVQSNSHYNKGEKMIENMKPSFISDPLRSTSQAQGEAGSNKVMFVPGNTGEAYWVMGTLFTYLVTGAESGGSYFTLIVDVRPEQGPPPHIHHLEEEQFYVLDGQLTYSVGDQTFQVSAGDFIHIPRGTVHSFRNLAITCDICPGRHRRVLPRGRRRCGRPFEIPTTCNRSSDRALPGC